MLSQRVAAEMSSNVAIIDLLISCSIEHAGRNISSILNQTVISELSFLRSRI